jgi:hypothetical protein
METAQSARKKAGRRVKCKEAKMHRKQSDEGGTRAQTTSFCPEPAVAEPNLARGETTVFRKSLALSAVSGSRNLSRDYLRK